MTHFWTSYVLFNWLLIRGMHRPSHLWDGGIWGSPLSIKNYGGQWSTSQQHVQPLNMAETESYRRRDRERETDTQR